MANQGRPREVGISAREAEVLAALGEHLTNAEIGARLFISIRTVESHVSSLLRKLQGRADLLPEAEKATLGRALDQNDHRQDFLRAKLARGPDGGLMATPFKLQDSSMLSVLHAADCLIVRSPHAPAAPEGSPCEVLRIAD